LNPPFLRSMTADNYTCSPKNGILFIHTSDSRWLHGVGMWSQQFLWMEGSALENALVIGDPPSLLVPLSCSKASRPIRLPVDLYCIPHC
jgi:hypothetical protein